MAHAIAPATRTSVERIPRSILRALGRIDRRLRTASALRGVGTTSLVGAIGAMLGMVVDVLWAVPEPVRWGIWLGWVVAVGGLLTTSLAAVVGRRRDASLGLAAVVERAFPQLGERLTGIVGLVGDPARRPHGSTVLISALADDAADSLARIEPARAVPLNKPARWFGFGLASVVMVAAPSVVRPDPFASIAKRFFLPWADVDRVSRLAMTITPGDTVAALGEELVVSAQITPRIGLGLVQGP